MSVCLSIRFSCALTFSWSIYYKHICHRPVVLVIFQPTTRPCSLIRSMSISINIIIAHALVISSTVYLTHSACNLYLSFFHFSPSLSIYLSCCLLCPFVASCLCPHRTLQRVVRLAPVPQQLRQSLLLIARQQHLRMTMTMITILMTILQRLKVIQISAIRQKARTAQASPWAKVVGNLFWESPPKPLFPTLCKH